MIAVGDPTPRRTADPAAAVTTVDTSLSGLSLTHLSGPGCPAYGDVPILPAVGPITGAPETMTAPFVSRSQRATPGSYSVTFARPSVHVDLAVTTRTGRRPVHLPAQPRRRASC